MQKDLTKEWISMIPEMQETSFATKDKKGFWYGRQNEQPCHLNKP